MPHTYRNTSNVRLVFCKKNEERNSLMVSAFGSEFSAIPKKQKLNLKGTTKDKKERQKKSATLSCRVP